MDLKGKVAFVTGGSGDIGGSIARALAGCGADVAVSYVGNTEGATSILTSIKASGTRGVAIELDQRDPASIETCVSKVLSEFNRLDILVNNAGWNIGIPFQDLDALTPEIWDKVLEINLRGPYLLARTLAPHLRRNGAGRIVNVASIAGLTPSGSSIAYAVSKAALIHLTHCLAVALAPEVTVNCIAPGLVEGTRLAQRVPDDVKKRYRAQAVLGRTGSIQDIAEQVIGFCRADSVTGQMMVIDGGSPVGMR